jgi:hypothetical protein
MTSSKCRSVKLKNKRTRTELKNKKDEIENKLKFYKKTKNKN